MREQRSLGSAGSWLRALVALQGLAIVVLGALLLRGDTPPAPSRAPSDGPTPTSPSAAASDAASPMAEDAAASKQPTQPPSGPAAAPATGPAAPQGTILYGRVVDARGEGVRDAVVWLTREGEQQPVGTVQTQQRPEFALAGLSPGTLSFRTRANGYRAQSGTIEIPKDTPRLRFDFVLQSAWNLAVKVLTPDGTPVHEALQSLARERPETHWLQVTALATTWQPDGDFPPTDQRAASYGVGRWRDAREPFGLSPSKLPKEFAGTLEMDEQQPLWVSAVLRNRVLATLAVEPGQPEVTLTVALEQVLGSLGTIRLRVVDGETREPVPGVRVGFSDQQSSGSGAPTDAEGRIEVRDLRPGFLQLDLAAHPRQGPLVEVLLQPGQLLDLGDVAVHAAAEIRGRCEGIGAGGQDGKVERLTVTAMPLEPPPGAALRAQPHRAMVASDGAFTLRVPPGRYFVRASQAGGATAILDTGAQGATPLVLALQPEAALRLDVQTRGEPCELTVIDSTGHVLWQRWVEHGWKFPILLLPGAYRLELRDRAGRTEVRNVQLGAEGLDLRVP